MPEATLPTGGQSNPQRESRTDWRKWRNLLLLLFAAGAIWLVRQPILTGIARVLIVDEPPGNPAAIWIRDSGVVIYDEAARLCRETPGLKILLVAWEPSRLVRAGVLEPLETITRREMAARGVPAEAIEVVGPPVRTGRQEINQLSAWLENRPGACAALPLGRFSSARQRQVLDEIMASDTASRVKIVALASPRYNESNWWRSREGLRNLAFGLLSRGYGCFCGSRGEDIEPWDPDQYEESLAETIAGEGR